MPDTAAGHDRCRLTEYTCCNSWHTTGMRALDSSGSGKARPDEAWSVHCDGFGSSIPVLRSKAPQRAPRRGSGRCTPCRFPAARSSEPHSGAAPPQPASAAGTRTRLGLRSRGASVSSAAATAAAFVRPLRCPPVGGRSDSRCLAGGCCSWGRTRRGCALLPPDVRRNYGCWGARARPGVPPRRHRPPSQSTDRTHRALRSPADPTSTECAATASRRGRARDKVDGFRAVTPATERLSGDRRSPACHGLLSEQPQVDKTSFWLLTGARLACRVRATFLSCSAPGVVDGSAAAIES